MAMPPTPEDPSLDPLDLLELETLLSQEERRTRDLARTFVRHHVLPEIVGWFESGRLPREIAYELGKRGLLGMHLSGYGCPGASAVAYGLACMELEAGDAGVRTFVSIHGTLAMFAIWRYGSEAQKRQWLPLMASGETIGCFALTEPDSGSDPASMQTTARRNGPDWILNGSKKWTTNGSIADVAVVWARTDEGVRGFVVPRDSPGLSAYDIDGKLSLRASVTSALTLEDVHVPAELRLPEATSLAAPLSCLNEARYGITWGAAGAARACLETALGYAMTRTQFGKPIGAFQLTQRKLAEMWVEVNQASLLALRLGRLKDAGRFKSEHASFGKLANVNAAIRVARTARSVLGANGITLEHPVMRHMVNLETVTTYDGTADIHSLILGAAMTGIPAFR